MPKTPKRRHLADAHTSPVFVPARSFVTASAIRRHGSLSGRGAQKNALRDLRDDAMQLLRPYAAAGMRFVERPLSHRARYRSASGSMPSVWRVETRATGVPGRQSVLYPKLHVLRGPALPLGDDQGDCRGTAPGLGCGQGVAQTVHATLRFLDWACWRDGK
jgi:hypothetical protein